MVIIIIKLLTLSRNLVVVCHKGTMTKDQRLQLQLSTVELSHIILQITISTRRQTNSIMAKRIMTMTRLVFIAAILARLKVMLTEAPYRKN